MILGCTKILLH